LAGPRLIERDHGWKALVDEVKRLAKQGPVAVAGVMAKTAKRPDGSLTNVDLAVIHEFGTNELPERSFIRASYSKNEDEYVKMAAAATKRWLDAKGRVQMSALLRPIAMKMASDMKAFVTGNFVRPPSSPGVVARKAKKGKQGAATPVTLVDSGKMVGAITWDVR
jgi:hypothetical protein